MRMTEISKEYASALFELAKEQGEERAFYTALRQIQKEFDAEPDYMLLLSAPNIPIRERHALLEQAFAEQAPEYVLSMVELMCEKGHIRAFHDCVQEYKTLYQAFCSVSSARVVSAVELTDSEKEALLRKLEKLSGHTVSVQYELDAALIGGIVIYMDDKIIDGSLRTKMKELKEVISQ